MNRREFFGRLSGMNAGDLVQVQDAYWLAKNAHREQMRDNGVRYFEHPRDVALMLIDRGFRERSVIIKALLHDVVEDTNTSPSTIVNMFGHDMWRSLFLLSKMIPVFDPITGQICGRYRKPDAVYYAELSAAPHEDRLVKCGDRLCNLRDMQKGWPKERQVKNAKETVEEVIPIAQMTDPWFHDAIKAEVDRILAG